jgi:hypothetical protein
MLFTKIIHVPSETHTEHTNTLCENNSEFLNVTAYIYHWVTALNGPMKVGKKLNVSLNAPILCVRNDTRNNRFWKTQ